MTAAGVEAVLVSRICRGIGKASVLATTLILAIGCIGIAL